MLRGSPEKSELLDKAKTFSQISFQRTMLSGPGIHSQRLLGFAARETRNNENVSFFSNTDLPLG